MNLFENYNIEYDSPDKKWVAVQSNAEKFTCLWFEEEKSVLHLQYDKNLKKIVLLEGSLGEKIANADLDNDTKISRVLEAIHNTLWDYFHTQKEHHNLGEKAQTPINKVKIA